MHVSLARSIERRTIQPFFSSLPFSDCRTKKKLYGHGFLHFSLNPSSPQEFVSSPACKNSIRIANTVLPPQYQIFFSAMVPESMCDTIANFIARDGLSGSYDWRDFLNNTYSLLRTAQPYFSVSLRENVP